MIRPRMGRWAMLTVPVRAGRECVPSRSTTLGSSVGGFLASSAFSAACSIADTSTYCSRLPLRLVGRIRRRAQDGALLPSIPLFRPPHSHSPAYPDLFALSPHCLESFLCLERGPSTGGHNRILDWHLGLAALELPRPHHRLRSALPFVARSHRLVRGAFCQRAGSRGTHAAGRQMGAQGDAAHQSQRHGTAAKGGQAQEPPEVGSREEGSLGHEQPREPHARSGASLQRWVELEGTHAGDADKEFHRFCTSQHPASGQVVGRYHAP